MPKIFKGKVVSDQMQKTRVVEVTRLKKVRKYGKYLKLSERFQAHDEKNEYKTGEKVLIQETRPLSKKKTWKIIKKI